MPGVAAPAKILVTGANGYIAIETVEQLIKDGYTVVGTVRRPESGEYVKKAVGEGFSYVIVKNFEDPTAFDEAVKEGNFDGILHLGSPAILGTPAEVIAPSVAGTTGILGSALKYGPSVKRVVLLSSIAAAFPGKQEPHVITESDWNGFSPAIIEKDGDKSDPWQVYYASKVLAEKAAWKFIEDNKSTVKFDLVAILPTFVHGPPKQDISGVDKLNESMKMVWEAAHKPSSEPEKAVMYNSVDVRDVAAIHIAALASPKAGGERFIATTGPYKYSEILYYLNQAGVKGVAPGGELPDWKADPALAAASGEKAEKILGIKYHDRKSTFVDAFNHIHKRWNI